MLRGALLLFEAVQGDLTDGTVEVLVELLLRAPLADLGGCHSVGSVDGVGLVRHWGMVGYRDLLLGRELVFFLLSAAHRVLGTDLGLGAFLRNAAIGYAAHSRRLGWIVEFIQRFLLGDFRDFRHKLVLCCLGFLDFIGRGLGLD